MFRALICPSSGVCEYVVELPHWLISFLVCCVLELGCGSDRVVSGLPAEAQPHPNSNTQQTKREISQCGSSAHSHKLLKMGILMPETCWVSKKKNKNSKWHLVGYLFFSYHKMHAPINIRFVKNVDNKGGIYTDIKFKIDMMIKEHN